jgi:hypothetical protein
MTEPDAIARLRQAIEMKHGVWIPPTSDDARAIIAHIEMLSAANTVWEKQWNAVSDFLQTAERERDTAAAALAQRDAQIVAWLREIAAQPISEGDTGQAVARRIACEFFADAIERGEYKEPK